MKAMLLRCFSVLLLSLAMGMNVSGSTNPREVLSISDSREIVVLFDELQISTPPLDRQGIYERPLVFSPQQVPSGNNQEQVSLSFCRMMQLAAHRTGCRVLGDLLDAYFCDLLGIRHLEGFYVFDLCKILI